MKLGSGIWDRFKLAIAPSLYPVLNRFHLYKWPTRVRIVYRNSQFSLTFTSAYDILVLEEVLLGHAYDFPYVHEICSIVDLGANIGASAVFFKSVFPEAEIRAFEPDQRAFSLLRENTRQFEGVALVNAVVDAHDGEATLCTRKSRTSGSSLIHRDGLTDSSSVQSISMDSILAAGPVDLVKFDIEGAELRVFAACTNLHRIKEFVGEVHLDLVNELEFFDVFESLDVTKRRIGPDRYLVHMVNRTATG